MNNNNFLLNKDKETAISEIKRMVELNKQLQSIYDEIVVPTIKKFNGKVYNIRFIKALREAIKDEMVWVKEMDSWNNEIQINAKYERWNYSHYETLYFRLVFNENGRIDADATLAKESNKKCVSNLQKHIDTAEDTLKNFDTYLNAIRDLYDMIKKVNDLPYTFRGNVNKNQLYIAV